MARLGITREFLAEFAKLEKPVRSAVKATIGKFAEHTHAGMQFQHSKGDRIRTGSACAGWASREPVRLLVPIEERAEAIAALWDRNNQELASCA